MKNVTGTVDTTRNVAVTVDVMKNVTVAVDAMKNAEVANDAMKNAAVTADVSGSHVDSTVKGVTVISSDGDTVQISTCVSVCTGATADDPPYDVMSNIVGIE